MPEHQGWPRMTERGTGLLPGQMDSGLASARAAWLLPRQHQLVCQLLQLLLLLALGCGAAGCSAAQRSDAAEAAAARPCQSRRPPAGTACWVHALCRCHSQVLVLNASSTSCICRPGQASQRLAAAAAAAGKHQAWRPPLSLRPEHPQVSPHLLRRRWLARVQAAHVGSHQVLQPGSEDQAGVHIPHARCDSDQLVRHEGHDGLAVSAAVHLLHALRCAVRHRQQAQSPAGSPPAQPAPVKLQAGLGCSTTGQGCPCWSHHSQIRGASRQQSRTLILSVADAGPA